MSDDQKIDFLIKEVTEQIQTIRQDNRNLLKRMDRHNGRLSKEMTGLRNEMTGLRNEMTGLRNEMAEMSNTMQLQGDSLTMLQTQHLAQASGAGRYVPEPRGIGPTARHLTEPRSRWKPTWFYGH